jgi:micrococcal nuclease
LRGGRAGRAALTLAVALAVGGCAGGGGGGGTATPSEPPATGASAPSPTTPSPPGTTPSPHEHRRSPRTPLPDGLDTTVTRIVDGDTLYVADLDERVRLIGVDTPETRHPDKGVECYGREATAHLRELVPPGTAVRVEFDVDRIDRYDRPLGYLWRRSDGLHVNLAMVADGYAQALTIPPNVKHADEFVAAQRRAREADRGLWSACPAEEA